MQETNKKVIILDNTKSDFGDGILYRWNGYGNDDSSISLLEKLEYNSDELRQRFLKIQRSFVSTLSKTISTFSKNTDIEIALLWSSLLVEKSVFKSPCLLDSLRLLSLEKELNKIECTDLCYIGPQQPVAEALRLFCERSNIKFFWDKTSSPNTDTLLRRIWKRLPNFVRSVVFLFHYAWNHWDLRKTYKPNWHDSTDTIFLFSYFIHLDRKSSETGTFYSKQWEVLPQVLEKAGKSLNWVHLFLFSPLVPNTATGIKWLNNFNRNKHQQSVHNFLSSYLGWDVLLRSLLDYCKCRFHFFLSNQKMNQAVSLLPHGWLWPVLRKDWQDSSRGITAMRNILQIHLFDKAIASLPHQPLGLYLCENQGWERSFIRSWRKHGHGKLIGVIHATISYWDMRHFDQSEKSDNIPRPDAIAVNGPSAWKILEAAGQPRDQYMQVEALRYQYLHTLPKTEDSRITLRQHNGFRRLLIFGDIRPEITHRMLLVMEQAFTDIESSYEIQIKPHPANPVDLRQYPLLRAEIVEEALNDLLPQADLVLTSVFTSAGLEALCFGTRVICYLDPYDLNYSLLRGIDGVEFISSSRDLFQALEQNIFSSHNSFKPENFFWLNPELPRWKALLGLGQKLMRQT